MIEKIKECIDATGVVYYTKEECNEMGDYIPSWLEGGLEIPTENTKYFLKVERSGDVTLWDLSFCCIKAVIRKDSEARMFYELGATLQAEGIIRY